MRTDSAKVDRILVVFINMVKKRSKLVKRALICNFGTIDLEVVLIYVENSFTCFFAIFFPGFFGQIVLLSFSKSRKNSDRKNLHKIYDK